MAPLILELLRNRRKYRTTVVLSGQHADLVKPILTFFGIEHDVDINLMQPNQTLASLTSRGLEELHACLSSIAPDWVIVQGDTTTAMASAMAAFYLKIRVAHLEAGLRTNRIDSPFPEEFNRRVISQIASLHWAPTRLAASALRREGMPLPHSKVMITGNSVIDALLWTVEKLRQEPYLDKDAAQVTEFLEADPKRRFVLVTLHRRENFGTSIKAICAAIRTVARKDSNTLFLLPMHPNPNVQTTVTAEIGSERNISLTKPKVYPEFVQLLDLCHAVVTDSGGVQEEAPALGKPVLVTRDTTERPEGLRTGLVTLAGVVRSDIEAALTEALQNSRSRKTRLRAAFPYGDGNTAKRCIDSLYR